MALDTYTALKTSIANWLGRDATDLLIPDYITLCEKSVDNNPAIRVREMTVTTTIISTGGLIPFPTGYLGTRTIRNTDNNALVLLDPQVMAQKQLEGVTGCPRWYMEQSGELHIFPVTENVSIDLTYYQELEPLSDSVATNWLLARFPNVYLFGSMIAATSEVMNDERVALWKAQYDEAVQLMVLSDERDRLTGDEGMKILKVNGVGCITG